MSFSNLAIVFVPSPNRDKVRTNKVCYITPHCMVGQLTAKGCGDLFAKVSYQASSNYGIGTAGDIGGYVDEEDRSVCSSSAWNDNRAITIECASDTRHPYAMNDKVWVSLIALCIDICLRYGKNKLMWFNDFLTGKGLNDYAIAGLMGNLWAESALRPNNLQNSFEKKLGMTDKGYTMAVNVGNYKNFIHDGAGYGLAQWTWWSRKQALLYFAQKRKTSIDDLVMQLEFLWEELQAYEGVMKVLNGARSVKEASDVVLRQFERPAVVVNNNKPGISRALRVRTDAGKGYFEKFADLGAVPEKFLTGYFVQFGAFQGKNNAKNRLFAVKEAGFDAMIEKSDGYFRVVSQVFEKMSDANELARAARQEGYNVIIKERKD